MDLLLVVARRCPVVDFLSTAFNTPVLSLIDSKFLSKSP